MQNVSNFRYLRKYYIFSSQQLHTQKHTSINSLLPSSESWCSLVSSSICLHHPSIRAVSACSSFRNQCPSLRHADMPPDDVCVGPPFPVPLPLSNHGSGGGREEGSRAGSKLSENEEELLLVVERLVRSWREGPLVVTTSSSWLPLSREIWAWKSTDWIALLTMTFFSVGLEVLLDVTLVTELRERSCVSESVSCLDAILLERLSLGV